MRNGLVSGFELGGFCKIVGEDVVGGVSKGLKEWGEKVEGVVGEGGG